MEDENLDLAAYDPHVNRAGVDWWLLRMFVRDVSKIQMLTKDDEAAVAMQLKTGDVASRDRLIESNLRFVVKIVFRYWSPGLPMMDMISEGCIGLIKAAKTYDSSKGFRFLTYAGDAIAQAVVKAIESYKRYEHDSLDDAIYGGETETSQRDVLISKDVQGDDTVFFNQVRDILDCLNDRERMIITLRFWDGFTYDAIGLRAGISRERVRQIEARALRKLRWAVERRGRV